MNIEQFYKTYPLVFPKGEPQCGFSCGDGWYQLLDSLFFVINKHLSEQTNVEFSIAQIKEKFGQLTIYYDGGTEYIEQTIKQATDMSKLICETCGEYGEIRNSSHWLKVRCDACETQHFASRIPNKSF